jgi:hypothetical protein
MLRVFNRTLAAAAAAAAVLQEVGADEYNMALCLRGMAACSKEALTTVSMCPCIWW